MRTLLVALLVAAACSSPAPAKTATPTATTDSKPPPAPPQPTADAATPLADCAEACTRIAGCWEEQNPGEDYHQGGFCVSECEAHTPEQKKTFFECVEKNGGECAAMLSCE